MSYTSCTRRMFLSVGNDLRDGSSFLVAAAARTSAAFAVPEAAALLPVPGLPVLDRDELAVVPISRSNLGDQGARGAEGRARQLRRDTGGNLKYGGRYASGLPCVVIRGFSLRFTAAEGHA